MVSDKRQRGIQLTDAAIDHVVAHMSIRERARALREALARVRDLEERLAQREQELDEVDLGAWEDDRLREWLPAAAESELVERLLARSEGLDWDLGRATRRVAELETENAKLRERLDAAYGRPPDDEAPYTGERVQLILNGTRGLKGDRWIVERADDGLLTLIPEELVAAVRPWWAASDAVADLRDVNIRAARGGSDGQG